ncbi:hypothetical protein [Streptomyces cadmiisoli]|uniref:hypothetical protein n=1 Tax=Streptomyces cadmiisoli TaxID=2184053 RepID=UPI003668AF42
MSSNAPLLNAPLLAILLGLIEVLTLKVADLEDQVAAARANVERQQEEHLNYRLLQGEPT